MQYTISFDNLKFYGVPWAWNDFWQDFFTWHHDFRFMTPLWGALIYRHRTGLLSHFAKCYFAFLWCELCYTFIRLPFMKVAQLIRRFDYNILPPLRPTFSTTRMLFGPRYRSPRGSLLQHCTAHRPDFISPPRFCRLGSLQSASHRPGGPTSCQISRLLLCHMLSLRHASGPWLYISDFAYADNPRVNYVIGLWFHSQPART